MPFGVKKSGNSWVVYKKTTGETFGKNKTKAGAKRQERAIEMNIHKRRGKK